MFQNSNATNHNEGNSIQSQYIKVFDSNNYIDDRKMESYTDKKVKDYRKRVEKFSKINEDKIISNGINGKVCRLIRKTNKLLETSTVKRKMADGCKHMNLFYNLSLSTRDPAAEYRCRSSILSLKIEIMSRSP